MVKGPFRKWDRVDPFCTLLVDLGSQGQIAIHMRVPFYNFYYDLRMSEPLTRVGPGPRCPLCISASVSHSDHVDILYTVTGCAARHALLRILCTKDLP